jgi:hypothetical protein
MNMDLRRAACSLLCISIVLASAPAIEHDQGDASWDRPKVTMVRHEHEEQPHPEGREVEQPLAMNAVAAATGAAPVWVPPMIRKRVFWPPFVPRSRMWSPPL